MKYNFRKAPPGAIDSLGTKYDLLSMMHYGGTAFTKNGHKTIEVIDWKKRLLIGQRSTFSNNDVTQLNLMYNCHVPKRTVPPKKCIDTSSSCTFYKDKGYCTSELNEGWMYKVCCQTCFGKTGGVPASPPPGPKRTTKRVTKFQCVDITDKATCQYWARLGNCNSRMKAIRDFTRKQCCATCTGS